MKELSDNEIRVIGEDVVAPCERSPLRRPRWPWWLMALLLMGVIVGLVALLHFCKRSHSAPEEVYFDSATVVRDYAPPLSSPDTVSDTITGVTYRDTTINDVALEVYVPHNLKPHLRVGEIKPHRDGENAVMALQAADIRADNKEIVSAFVLKGEILAKGSAKLGYCAVIDGKITIGVDEATPLYELAIEREGDFFRQYPLVSHRKVVENNIKNKAFRRALAQIDDRIVVVMTTNQESLHDFSQALVDMGVETAINLVGGKMISGWVEAIDTLVIPIGVPIHDPYPPSINYIVWTK